MGWGKKHQPRGMSGTDSPNAKVTAIGQLTLGTGTTEGFKSPSTTGTHISPEVDRTLSQMSQLILSIRTKQAEINRLQLELESETESLDRLTHILTLKGGAPGRNVHERLD